MKAYAHCAHVTAYWQARTAAAMIRAIITRQAARGDANARAALEELHAEPHLAAAAALADRHDLSAADQIFAASLTAMGWDADAL